MPTSSIGERERIVDLQVLSFTVVPSDGSGGYSPYFVFVHCQLR